MKVVIAGGGTGGHLFPGIAVAEEFKRRDEQTDVTFIGTRQGLEARVVPKEGYEIKFIKSGGLIGKSAIDKARGLWRLAGSISASKKMLRELRPDIVIGTGGYVSAGPVVSARMLSIPSLIMEQNLVPGLANKVLSRVSDAVTVTYHESIPFLPKTRIFFTGNPVRQSVLRGDKAVALMALGLEPDRRTVLILGGSSGARSINNAMVSALAGLLGMKNDIQLLHQTGEKDHEAVKRAYGQWGFVAKVEPFLYEMADAYAAADLVVSRAGATTLAELTALGKPSILIPYPYAGGHQEFNAKKLADMGACRMLSDHDLSGELLAAQIKGLLSSEAALSMMGKQSRALGRPDAARKVVDIAESLVKARQDNSSKRSRD